MNVEFYTPEMARSERFAEDCRQQILHNAANNTFRWIERDYGLSRGLELESENQAWWFVRVLDERDVLDEQKRALIDLLLLQWGCA